MYRSTVIPFPQSRTKRHVKDTGRDEYAAAGWTLRAQERAAAHFAQFPGRRHILFNGVPEEYLALLPPERQSFGLAAVEDGGTIFCAAQRSRCGRGIILLSNASLDFEPDERLLAFPEMQAREIFEAMLAMNDPDYAPVARSIFLARLNVARAS